MRTGRVTRVTFVLAVSLVFFFIVSLTGAVFAEQRKLERDTMLPIPFLKTKITFAAGTSVRLDDSGNVMKGVLARETPLKVAGLDVPVAFAKNSVVEFDMMGRVAKGIPVSDNVYLIDGSKKPIKFKGGLPVAFGQTGVQCGTLAEKAKLPNPKNKNIEEEYPAGTYVMFTITGGVYLIQPPGK